MELLHEAGFLDGVRTERAILIRDLSLAGHEFVAATRNSIVWSALRSRFGADLSVMPLEMIRTVAAKLTAEMIVGRAA